MPYIRLNAHYTRQDLGELYIGTIGGSLRLGDGTTVELPVPYVPISAHLGIAPAIVPDGQSALRIDFTRWSPVRYGKDLVAHFPFHFSPQETAVAVARAFDADPGVHWQAPVDEIGAWLATWGPANGLSGPIPGAPASGADPTTEEC